MVKNSLFLKNLTNHLPAKIYCLIGPAVVAILFLCAPLQIISAEICCADTKMIAHDLKSENEQQKLRKHILVMTSQPYVTDWFNALDNSLRNNLFSFLTSDSKLSYEYIGSESLTDSDYNKKFKDFLKKKYARIKLDMIIAVMPISSQFIDRKSVV
jgi:hypothetical protein